MTRSQNQPTARTSEKLFFSGDEYFQDLIQHIRRAKEQILFEVYIFSNDQIGELILQELQIAANRGVNVFLIVDGLGSQSWIHAHLSLLSPQQKINLRIFHPTSFQLMFQKNSDRKLYRCGQKIDLFLSRLNRRDHRKLVIIDHQTAWIGSFNVDRRHSETHHHTPWLDAAVRIEGHGLHALEKTFFYVWKKSNGTVKSLIQSFFKIQFHQTTISPSGFYSNLTRSARRHTTKSFTRRISQAKQRIWLTNPYIAPPNKVLRALRQAALRGVDVRLYLSPTSDVFFMPWVAKAHYKSFLNAGIRLFEMPDRFIHAKCLLIDDEATIGSSNFNRRSMIHDYEVDVILTMPESKNDLIQEFQKIEKMSREVKAFSFDFLSVLGSVILFFFGRFL